MAIILPHLSDFRRIVFSVYLAINAKHEWSSTLASATATSVLLAFTIASFSMGSMLHHKWLSTFKPHRSINVTNTFGRQPPIVASCVYVSFADNRNVYNLYIQHVDGFNTYTTKKKQQINAQLTHSTLLHPPNWERTEASGAKAHTAAVHWYACGLQ